MNEVWNSLALFLVMLLLGSSMVLWFRACVQLHAGRPLVPPEVRQPHPWGLLDVLVVIAANILLTGIVGAWLQSAGKLDASLSLEQMSREQRGTYIIASAIIPLASLVLVIGWLWIRYRSSARELGFQWRQWMSDIRLGLAAFAMLAPVVFFIQYVVAQQVE